MDILILAAIAGFILYRLYSVLGQDVGFKQEQNKATPSNPSQMKKAFNRDQDQSNVSVDLAALQSIDPDFNIDEFLEGVRNAFGMILEAVNKGDKKTLQMLMAPRLYKQFDSMIDNREIKKQALENNLIRIKSTDIQDIEIKESKLVFITVKVVSEQILVIRDAKGNVLEGDPDQIETLTDVITFSRDATSDDPNWIMIKSTTTD